MHLLQHLFGPMLIIWDRLLAHRSRLLAEFLACLQGEIVTQYLPGYPPELNRSNTSGATGSITSYPTCTQRISGNSAKAHAPPLTPATNSHHRLLETVFFV